MANKNTISANENINSPKTATILVAFLVIVLNVLVTKILPLLDKNISLKNDTDIINRTFYLVAGGVIALFIWKTPLTFNLDALKIHDKKKFKKETLISAVVSFVLILGMLVFRVFLNRISPVAASRPAFGLYLNIHARWFYPLNVILQEAVIKGLMQENFRTLNPEGNQHFSIWVNGLFFMILHMNYPLYYMVGAGILCIATGYIYEHYRDIWGSSLIHFVIGFMPRALGLK
ncbi:MAG: CPBP family intramembrane metalloprotease [Lachnospiraceae bacterium]|nr:CPBP family intramembrane metalloprotease [Lachnospiraceae bacterium]